MSNNINTDIQTLHTEVKTILAKTRSRATRTAILIWLLILVIAGYWTYLYSRIGEVNAETVSQLAYQQALEYARSAPPVLSKAMRDRAPEVYGFIETKVMESPALIAGQIEKVAVAQTQTVLDHSAPKINEMITAAIADAKQATLKAGYDGKDPAQLDKLIDAAGAQASDGLISGFRGIYSEYDQTAKAAVDYLQEIAAGKNLDTRQQHLRDVFISFLAVAEKRRQMQ